ncbi:hypothetical protein BDA99DRAFT_542693 [Phascolomyces articulosus]|uniref:Uncharacterized protein n=1 Tax=Phascolomyces articulosus TaxID=60185 RepID=A0AAD5P8C6_9FUNG|nr:hypothetical protein BDA99DRAFT_542693 [Phascolomyces articulosus]
MLGTTDFNPNYGKLGYLEENSDIFTSFLIFLSQFIKSYRIEQNVPLHISLPSLVIDVRVIGEPGLYFADLGCCYCLDAELQITHIHGLFLHVVFILGSLVIILMSKEV